jgi:hypothetical protein
LPTFREIQKEKDTKLSVPVLGDDKGKLDMMKNLETVDLKTLGDKKYQVRPRCS